MSKEEYEGIIKQYFRNFKELHNGNKDSIENLLNLWDSDGSIEYCGADPLTGAFYGRNALNAYYKTILYSARESVELKRQKQSFQLRNIDGNVEHLKIMDDKAVVHWISSISLENKKNFQIACSSTFKFKENKIINLKTVFSPHADLSEDLKLENLGIDDIGRLALVAWAVV